MDLIEWVKRIGRDAPIIIEKVTIRTVERITIDAPHDVPAKKYHGTKLVSKSGGIRTRFRGKGCITPAEKKQLMSERGLKFVE